MSSDGWRRCSNRGSSDMRLNICSIKPNSKKRFKKMKRNTKIFIFIFIYLSHCECARKSQAPSRYCRATDKRHQQSRQQQHADEKRLFFVKTIFLYIKSLSYKLFKCASVLCHECLDCVQQQTDITWEKKEDWKIRWLNFFICVCFLFVYKKSE